MNFLPLEEFAEFVMGQAPPGHTCNENGEGTPFVKAGEFGEDSPIIREWTTKPLQLARRSDVLVCVVGATSGKVNLGADCAIGRSVAAVRPKDGKLCQRFAFHFLRTQTPRLRSGSQGSAQGVITRGMLGALDLPAFTPSEQRRIAEILDSADAIRRKRREAIALTDELLRSTFLEMFGDPISNPKGFEIRALGELADVNRGKFSPRPRNDPRFYGGEFPFIQTGDLRNATGYLRTWKQTLNEDGCAVSRGFHRGTVAIAIAANIGDAAIVDFDFYCPDSVVGIVPRPSLATSEYLEVMLRYFQPKLIAEAPETAQKNINLDTLRPLPVPAPSRTAQETFGFRYRKISELTVRMEDAAVEADVLFRSLVTQAFRGDLVAPVVEEAKARRTAVGIP